MIGLEQVYWLAGAMFAAIAVRSLADRANRRRGGNFAFWGLLAVSFLFGSKLGDLGNGMLVLALTGLGAFAMGMGAPRTTSVAERESSARVKGNSILTPALIIPIIAIAGTLTLGKLRIDGGPVADPKQVTLIALALGIVSALAVAVLRFRPPVLAAVEEGRRLCDAIGWAIILPQLLASLGAVFALSGVGGAVGRVAASWLPLGHPFAAVAVYCIGMALFTMVMGNAFAAFPVMTAAIGVPLIVHRFGGDPAIMGAIGMLAGFCGTLATPMAANYNIVPAALLELPDRNGVIRAQIPTAIPLLLCNIVLMYVLVFRF